MYIYIHIRINITTIYTLYIYMYSYLFPFSGPVADPPLIWYPKIEIPCAMCHGFLAHFRATCPYLQHLRAIYYLQITYRYRLYTTVPASLHITYIHDIYIYITFFSTYKTAKSIFINKSLSYS